MFTDLKDSTSITTRLGDVAAMELIRTHDSLIRGVLALRRGREVKHTGDGFMLSFPLVGDAILAACDIQDRFATYNAGGPAVPLRVRIGIAGGEPVVEGTDLFGRAVQMAARLCALAEVGEILAQSDLRPLGESPQLAWGADRQVSLKGFDAPVRVAPVQRAGGL
jgi:class 3 adenylate cyclase